MAKCHLKLKLLQINAFTILETLKELCLWLLIINELTHSKVSDLGITCSTLVLTLTRSILIVYGNFARSQDLTEFFWVEGSVISGKERIIMYNLRQIKSKQ